MRDRETDRARERDRETDRERERGGETDRAREREIDNQYLFTKYQYLFTKRYIYTMIIMLSKPIKLHLQNYLHIMCTI